MSKKPGEQPDVSPCITSRGNPASQTDTTTTLRQSEEGEDEDVNHVNRKGLEGGGEGGEGEGNFPED